MRQKTFSKTTNALGNLIDDKFYTILVNKIKSEVKLALNDIFNGNTIKEVNDAIIKDGNYKKESNVNDVLIITLREEIKFLRDELKSKDKIVQLIIQEKGNQCNVKKSIILRIIQTQLGWTVILKGIF